MASTHHEDYRLLIEMLREARQREGVSQVDLAVRLGSAQKFISKVERGERRLDVIELIEFFEALGISPVSWMAEYLDRRKSLHMQQEIKRKTPTFGRDNTER